MSGDGLSKLRGALGSFVAGTDRTEAGVRRIGELLADVDGLPWLDELAYACRRYGAEVQEAAFAELAGLALTDWSRRPRWRRVVPPDANRLRRRWTGSEGVRRAREVAAALESGVVDAAPLGTHQGRTDLRGYVHPGPKYEARKIAGLVGIDLAGADLRWASLRSAVIKDCRFDGAELSDLEMWGTEVQACSFRNANLSHAAFAGRAGGEMTRCLGVDFTGANLGRAWADFGARFEDCEFADARLSDTELHADLVHCHFGGRVEGLMVFGEASRGPTREPVQLEDVDFRDAELELCGFRWVDHCALILPKSDDLRVVDDWPCVYSRLASAAEALPPDERSFSTRLTLAHEPRWTVGPRRTQLIELGYLRRNDSPEGFAQLVRLLDEAQIGCGGL